MICFVLCPIVLKTIFLHQNPICTNLCTRLYWDERAFLLRCRYGHGICMFPQNMASLLTGNIKKEFRAGIVWRNVWLGFVR